MVQSIHGVFRIMFIVCGMLTRFVSFHPEEQRQWKQRAMTQGETRRIQNTVVFPVFRKSDGVFQKVGEAMTDTLKNWYNTSEKYQMWGSSVTAGCLFFASAPGTSLMYSQHMS